MKNVWYIIAVFLLVGCSTAKKVVTETDTEIHTAKTDTTASVDVHTAVIDTAWWDSGTYTHTIITFEPDTMMTQAMTDSSHTNANVMRPDMNRPTNVVSVGGINIETSSPVKIHRIETTTIAKQSAGQQHVEKRDSTEQVQKTTDVANVEEHKQVQKTPVRVIRPWMVYVGLLLIAAIAVAVWYKRTTGKSLLRTILSFVRKLI